MDCAAYMSPNLVAFPVVAMVTTSMTLVEPGFKNPPINTARTESDVPPAPPVATVRSPKSTASPVVAIVK